MSQPKDRKQIYGGRRPDDYLPARNYVAQNGSRFRRFWIPPQWVEGGGWAKCPCAWGGLKWQPHYAWSEHTRKKAQHHVRRRLQRATKAA